MKGMIDNTELTYPDDFFMQDQFVVSSMPRNYTVTWEKTPAPCDTVNRLLATHPNNILLIDAKVFALYGHDISHPQEKIIQVPATETFKTLEGMTQVFDFLYQNNFTKGETLVIVGGGIVQDIGAFVGAIYKRGIRWVHCPTTLLAMSDSCIGGKSGINYKASKNQLALFSTPHAVHIHPGFLSTLEQPDLQSGLGEILKLCITGGPDMVAHYARCVQKGKIKSVQDAKILILAALNVKKVVIEHDEFEAHLRKSLNYGHTLGHVLESLSHYALPHGIAVVLGMLLVNDLSCQQGFLSRDAHREIMRLCCDLLDEDRLEIMKKLDIHDVIRYLKQDKKVAGDEVTFILLKEIGQLEFVSMKMDNHLMIRIQEAFHRIVSGTQQMNGCINI